MIRERLERLIYITEDKFGMKEYRLPIVWIDKLVLLGGIIAAIIGRIAAITWVVSYCLEKPGFLSSVPFAVCAVLVWAGGEYFTRAGNRGLIYHHMDLLADYLDRNQRDKAKIG